MAAVIQFVKEFCHYTGNFSLNRKNEVKRENDKVNEIRAQWKKSI